jgi:hypothetical protein
MVKVVKAPDEYRKYLSKPSVFLAGSIDMGEAVDWQQEITDALEHLDVLVLNPRRDDWDSSWKQDISDPQFAKQVNWELDALAEVDLIVVYFDPKGQAPISLLELGLHADTNIIVCCPEGYWKRGNVQIVCARKGIPLLETLDELIEATVAQFETE